MDWITSHNNNAFNNLNILCIAEGNSVSLMLDKVKHLHKQGKKVMAVFIGETGIESNLLKEFKLFTSNVKLIDAKPVRLISNEVYTELYNTVAANQITQIFAIGGVYTIKEILDYLYRKHQIEYSCILDTTKSENAKIKGMFDVSFCPKSKYICVTGENFEANYKTIDDFVERFCELDPQGV
jgi:hypothetical protein